MKRGQVTLFIILGIIFVFIIGLVLYLTDGSILIMIISTVAMFSIIVIFTCTDKQRRRMWVKLFGYDNSTVIRTIENILKENKISYKKLRVEKDIFRFPLKYSEIFVLNNGQQIIKIQKQRAMGSSIELGPISGINKYEIDKLKNIIDEGFKPKGL